MCKVRFIEHIIMSWFVYLAVHRGTAKVKPEEVQATPTEKVTVAAAVSVTVAVEVRSLVTTSLARARILALFSDSPRADLPQPE